MNKRHEALFSRLSNACGVSGYTSEVSTIFKEIAGGYGLQCGMDSMGSVSAVLQPKEVSGFSRNRIMISAHLDTVGYIVAEKEDDTGTLKLYKVGLPSLEGTTNGIIKTSTGRLFVKIEDKGIDEYTALVILEDKKDILKVEIGDPVFYNNSLIASPKGKFTAAFMDNRASILIMLMAMEKIIKAGTTINTLFFVLTEFEEIGGYGAIAATNKIKPSFAINLDVFPVEKKSHLSFGTAISRGMIYNPILVNYAISLAKKYKIPYELKATSPENESNSNFILPQNGGTPCCEIGPPCVNIHLPNEIVSKKSLDSTADLLTYMCLSSHTIKNLIPGEEDGM